MQITKSSFYGEVRIEQETLENIAQLIGENISGLYSFTNSRGQQQSVLNVNNKCIELKEDDERYSIDVYILVKFVFSIKETSKKLIEQLREAFRKSFDIDLEDVNVHVMGIKLRRYVEKSHRMIKG